MITEQQQGQRVPELFEVLELIDQAAEEEKIVEIIRLCPLDSDNIILKLKLIELIFQ